MKIDYYCYSFQDFKGDEKINYEISQIYAINLVLKKI